jgi:integrase
VAVLRRHKAAQNQERLLAGPAWADNDLVFASHTGAPVDDKTARAAHRGICRGTKLPLVRLHDPRHTAATLMLLAGVNGKVVSERLGHASVVITLQTYSHVLPTMQRDAADALDALLRAQTPARSQPLLLDVRLPRL